MKTWTDAERLLTFFLDVGVEEIGSVDIYDEASISAAEHGRDEPNDEDVLFGIRVAIDKAFRPEYL